MAPQTDKGVREGGNELLQMLRVLLKRWRLILVLTALSVLASLAVSLIRSPTYEATAPIIITEIHYRFQFNPFVSSSDAGEVETPPIVEILHLTQSEHLLQEVLLEVQQSGIEGAASIEDFDGILEWELLEDERTIELRALAGSPQLAAEIAGTWSRRLIEAINEIYPRVRLDRSFFASQLEFAQVRLEAADQAVIEHQGQDLSTVLQARLNALNERLSSYLKMQNTLASVQQNLAALKSLLSVMPEESPSQLEDDLVALGLQITALNTSIDVPIEFQLTAGETLSARTAGEQLEQLVILEQVIEDLSDNLAADIDALPESILEFQVQIEEANTVSQALETERDLAREAYRSLERKLSESIILAESVPAGAALGWRETPPTEYAGPITWRNSVLAGALGLCIGVLVAFMMESLTPRRPVPETK
ncbi:MAG: Wzz/FepE/Etk N-terminal domain-containing protein [Anaerolineales bacterium]|jgi:capsular polysaccharide biosynthesis protein